MLGASSHDEPNRRRRGRGDDGISWDRANKCYVGTVTLGYLPGGKRDRRTVRGRTKAQVKDRLDELHEEIKSGVRTPATYTVEQCVTDWLGSIERDPHTMETITGQARNWIYPRIGGVKLKNFNATRADKFFHEIAPFLSKRSLVMIKSTLRRSIRRAQVHDLIGRNVVELIDLPPGKPGRPSRAMTQSQAPQVLKVAKGQISGYVKAVSWRESNLVFCHEDGSMYTSDALNWRFSKMTRKAGIGRWHAHEGRHTAVSIMSSNGVPIQEISDTVGHKSTHVTETVYRHVIVPAIRGGATVMDSVFEDDGQD